MLAKVIMILAPNASFMIKLSRRRHCVTKEMATYRTIIEQPGNTTIYFEGGGVEHAPSEHGVHGLPVEGLTLESSGRHDCLFLLRYFDFRCLVLVDVWGRSKRSKGILSRESPLRLTSSSCEAAEGAHSLGIHPIEV